jgi:glycosyltransferase involved in cell wall biosynthesis
MNLGLIARADNSGLGMQTYEFYRHMHPAKTMVVDISRFNGNKQYPERYPENATFIYDFPQPPQIDEFLKGLDVVFIAEAAYNPYVYDRARELGVKTAVQYNYEFFDWFNPNVPKPDMFIAPSRWNYENVQALCDEHDIKHVYLHCPVDREKLPFKPKTQFKTFLHAAGRSAAHDRNGTMTVIAASRYITSDAKIKLHFQGEQGLPHQATTSINDYRELIEKAGDPNKITLEQHEYENYQDVYNLGDVLLLPRRYGGNCLPLNEALSLGMPVIMTDIMPNNFLLPPAWVLPAQKIDEFTPRTTIDIYGTTPEALANKIDLLANAPPDIIEIETKVADAIAQQISWETMEPLYREALESLCTQ